MRIRNPCQSNRSDSGLFSARCPADEGTYPSVQSYSRCHDLVLSTRSRRDLGGRGIISKREGEEEGECEMTRRRQGRWSAAATRTRIRGSGGLASGILAAALAASLVGQASCAVPMRKSDAAALQDMVGRWAPMGWDDAADPCTWPGIECGKAKEGMIVPAEVSYVKSISLSGVCPNAEAMGLSCVVPDSFGTLEGLESAFLAGNGFVGHLPGTLGGLKSMKWLYLNANRLTGEIPQCLGRLPALEKLFLNDNHLSGEIPEELGKAKALHHLELQRNELFGEIPKELGLLSDLVQLDLSENRLTGEIPDELGDLGELHRLDLHGNMLTGSIPARLLDVKMQALMRINLSNNKLTGHVPYGICHMLRLVLIKLREGNNLEGDVVECDAPHGFHGRDHENRQHCREQMRDFCVTLPPFGLHEEL